VCAHPRRQEVDDFVLQEFLTDIIGGAAIAPRAGEFNTAFGGGLLAGAMMPTNAMMFNGGGKNNSFNGVHMNGGHRSDPSSAVMGAMGSGDFAALMNAPPIPPGPIPALRAGAMVGDGYGGGGGAAQKLQTAQQLEAAMVAREKEEDEEDEGGDPEQRRKRQREANLQAQRRCRERHRNHVTNLEKEVRELRNEVIAARDKNTRLSSALQQNLKMVEECQKRWNNTNKERDELTREKDELKLKMEETLKTLQRVSFDNMELETKLKYSVSPTVSGGSEVAAVNGNGNHQSMQYSLQEDATALQEDATELVAAARKEREAGAVQLSDAVEDGMNRLTMHLTAQFRTFLVDGNACSQMGVFSVHVDPEAPAEPGALPPPCAAMMAQGPGQTKSVFKLAHAIARVLDLTDAQRHAVIQRWKFHASKLNDLFDRRKKLKTDALLLQGTSPVATLVDFMSIGAGVLSGGIKSEEEMVEKGGIVTLTGFAQHACRVENVISDLRENIGSEQKQNFVLVTQIVDDVLTPFQTCMICSMWQTGGCPDLLAISRAITVQSMQCMPQLMQQQQQQCTGQQ
jgi:hypothetical protein